MGRSGELALTFESSERVASSAEATGGRELFSPLAHTRREGRGKEADGVRTFWMEYFAPF